MRGKATFEVVLKYVSIKDCSKTRIVEGVRQAIASYFLLRYAVLQRGSGHVSLAHSPSAFLRDAISSTEV